MTKTSTQSSSQAVTTSKQMPKKRTLDFLRSFARAYQVPVCPSLPGIVLN